MEEKERKEEHTEERAEVQTEEQTEEQAEKSGDIYSQFEVLPIKPKKNRRALKIILGIILSLVLVLILGSGIFISKFVQALDSIKSEQPTTGDASSDTVPGTQPDESSSYAESESTEQSGEDVSGEEPATAAGEDASGETVESTAAVEKTTSGAEKTTAAGEKTTSRPEKTTAAGEKTTSGAEKTTSGAEKTTAAVEKTTSGAEKTTAAVEKTTSGGSQSPAKPSEQPTAAPITGKNEYDIYRSGRFYALGEITDADGTVSPMELAITPESIYMVSNFEGMNIGLLHCDDKTYMINTDDKTYTELNSFILNMVGGDADELFDTSNFGFEDMKPVEKALSSSDEVVRGVSCKKYVFPPINDDTVYHIYLNGTKFVRLVSLDLSGNINSTIDFKSVTDKIPEEKTKPSSAYEKKGMIEFLMDLSDSI